MKLISTAVFALLTTSSAYADTQAICNAIQMNPPSINFQLTKNTATQMTGNMVISNIAHAS